MVSTTDQQQQQESEPQPLQSPPLEYDSGNSKGESSELLKDVEEIPEIKINFFLGLCVGMVSIASCLLGYDIGVMSGAILFIEEDFDKKGHPLEDWEIELLVGSLNMVSAVGALFAGPLSDRIGRRKTILTSALIFTSGAIGMAVSIDFWSLLAFRVVTGVGVGVGLVLAPLYVAELAPSSLRGSLVSLGEVMVNIGILLGYIVNFSFSNVREGLAWRLMLGLGGVPSIILFIGIFFMPESPRWLVANGRKDEAEQVFIKADYPPAIIPQMVNDIEEMVNLAQQQAKVKWSDVICCPTKLIRTTMIVGVGICFFQQATGCEAAVYYTPKVLEDAGIESTQGLLAASMIMGIVKVLCIFPPLLYMEKYGRKDFLYLSTLGMMFAHLLSAVAFWPEEPMAYLALFSICLFVAFFSLGIGPINWVLTSEVFPLVIRGRAMSIATLVNRLTSGTVALSYLSLSELLTPSGSYILFAVISFIAFLFVLFIVPETKGKTLEELEQMFAGEDEKEVDYE